MLKIPVQRASDDEWFEYAEQSCEALTLHLTEFLADRFTYKPRYVNQHLNRSFATVSAKTHKYDLYFRAFPRPHDFWPRESITIARVMFKERRAGHGRSLIEMLVKLAPKFGYKYLSIECANENAAAFAQRMGFTRYEDGRHWVGSIVEIQQSFVRQSHQP
ncbi:GNAT family N-acetyltransferase [Pseudomonas sp. TH34]|uniref:GNAT family N-acetyltransferase n=1 Tax=Pseudomonas sp. TH34 TaxID=2796399 RepID=UPI001912D3D9|nr:GNAT family N-acetyltransferase [Pseudomonas sp. TH34]MBK5410823.1 GNAT family N-acetyltransferase [Pseudomonas sp. TH34]